jgi:hypothetical protein
MTKVKSGAFHKERTAVTLCVVRPHSESYVSLPLVTKVYRRRK